MAWFGPSGTCGCCECIITDLSPGLRWIDWTGEPENNAFYGSGDGWTYGGGWSHVSGTAQSSLQSATPASLSRTIAMQASGTTTLLVQVRTDAATPKNGTLEVYVGGVLRLTQSTSLITAAAGGQTLNVTTTLTGDQTVELRLTGAGANSASSKITVFSVTRFGSGVVPATTTVTRTIARPTGNWTVDIETTARASGTATITVGSIVASVGVTTITAPLGSCTTRTQSGSYWIRFQETTLTVSGTEKRRRRIAVFTTDPSPLVGDLPTAVWSECQDFAIETDPPEEMPEEVTITVVAGTGSITLGTARIRGTEQDNSNCPPVPCTMPACVEGSTSGGPKLFIATNVRLQVTGYELLYLKYTYSGMAFQSGGATIGPIDIWEKLEWDLGVLNGTYAYQLFDGGTGLDPTQTQAVIDSVKEVGLCPSQNARYAWRCVNTINISTADTYSRGPNSVGAGWDTNFPASFTAYTSSTIAAWFNNAWVSGGAPTTVLYNPGTMAYPSMWPRPYRPSEETFLNSLVREQSLGVMTNAIRGSQSGESNASPTVVVGNSPAVSIPLLHCSERVYSDSSVFDINGSITYSPASPGTHTLTFESNVTTLARTMLIDYVEI